MTLGYVFEAGEQQAITVKSDGSNLPAPNIEKWKHVKTVDVNKPGWRATFDGTTFTVTNPDGRHIGSTEIGSTENPPAIQVAS